jgi:M6 family metalloprotease-like protein
VGSKTKKSAELSFSPATTNKNLKLWVFDPENSNKSLNSPGIFYKRDNGDWTWAGSNVDGTVYVDLPEGSYIFDTVEPNRNTEKYKRKTYSLEIDSKLVPRISGLIANSQGIFTVTIDLQVTSPLFQPKNVCQLRSQDGSSTLNNGFPRSSERLRDIGAIRALIIPVDFPDVIGSGNPAEVYYDMATGMDEFFKKMSDNRVSFSFQIYPNYLRLNFKSDEYGLGRWNSGNSFGYYKAAIDAADPFIDFSKFDVVYILSPRNIPWSSIAYGPAFPVRVETDDGWISNGTFSGADAYQNILGADWKWMAHETGHLFGLHDLYTSGSQKPTYGEWDLMSNNFSTRAIEINSWNRYITNWLNDSQIDCLDRASISTATLTRELLPLSSSNSGQKAQFVKLSDSKILVMEYRKSGGFDNLPAGNVGVLVYTVDMTITTMKGGWSVQRRPGSTHQDFLDAALRAGDKIIVEGIEIEVVNISDMSATLRVRKS